jgi:hypothetical protein
VQVGGAQALALETSQTRGDPCVARGHVSIALSQQRGDRAFAMVLNDLKVINKIISTLYQKLIDDGDESKQITPHSTLNVESRDQFHAMGNVLGTS